MSRYFFHIRNGFGDAEDEEGRDLPGLDAVRDEALKGVRSLLSEEVLAGVVDLRGRLDVVDGDGRTVLTMPFAEALTIKD